MTANGNRPLQPITDPHEQFARARELCQFLNVEEVEVFAPDLLDAMASFGYALVPALGVRGTELTEAYMLSLGAEIEE